MAKLSFHYRASIDAGDVSLYVDDEHAITLHLAEIPNLHLEDGALSPAARDYLVDASGPLAEKTRQPRFTAMLPQLFALYDSMRGSGVDFSVLHGTASFDVDMEYPDDWQGHDHDGSSDDPGGLRVKRFEVAFDQIQDVSRVVADVVVVS